MVHIFALAEKCFLSQGWQTTGQFLADTNNHSFCLYISSATDSRVQLHDMSFFFFGAGEGGGEGWD